MKGLYCIFLYNYLGHTWLSAMFLSHSGHQNWGKASLFLESEEHHGYQSFEASYGFLSLGNVTIIYIFKSFKFDSNRKTPRISNTILINVSNMRPNTS